MHRVKSATGVVHQVRLATGLVLFTYLVTHFLNHSLGLVSLAAAEAGLVWFRALWANGIGLTLLFGALTIHLGLAFWSLWRRRSLRLHRWEAVQLLVGLMVPPLLAVHVLGTRGAEWRFDITPSYAYVLTALWAGDLWSTLRQVATLLLAWLHGCIGLHFWLRLKPWYAGTALWLYGAALLLPTLALLGFVFAGREVVLLMADPAWMAALAAHTGTPPAGAVAAIYRADRVFLVGYLAALALVMVARLVRGRLNRRRAVAVTYAGGRRVEVPPGSTILEASRSGGIPHASICGGRGRCSTCRVRVHQGAENLSPMREDEAHVLRRVGAPPGVRLACQARPSGPVTVEPLLPPGATPRDARPRPGYLQGHEEEIAILFADLRAFTALAEQKLPYDVVFLLNRYFRALGTAVEAAGGRVDKFIGDGIMALFGVGGSGDQGCRQAIEAARRMAENLDEMNRSLAHDLPAPLRIGIGVHFGTVIVGEMGYGRATSITAIGDAVNAASRLEALTKDYGCQLVLAEEAAQRAGIDVARFERHEVQIRGRADATAVRVVPDARDLPAVTPSGSRA
jgi:adenylate cyclase